MKINPIGVQSYQEMIRRDQTPARTDNKVGNNAAKPVTIAPQEETQRPKLAVRAPKSNYAQQLNPDEQRALDLLFTRFRDSGRFGSGYRAEAAEADEASLGHFVDLKA